MNNLQIRFIDYADSVMTITERMRGNPSFLGIVNQLNRSSSSIGANYSEAQSATSKKDYHNKVRIALKESRHSKNSGRNRRNHQNSNNNSKENRSNNSLNS